MLVQQNVSALYVNQSAETNINFELINSDCGLGLRQLLARFYTEGRLKESEITDTVSLRTLLEWGFIAKIDDPEYTYQITNLAVKYMTGVNFDDSITQRHIRGDYVTLNPNDFDSYDCVYRVQGFRSSGEVLLSTVSDYIPASDSPTAKKYIHVLDLDIWYDEINHATVEEVESGIRADK